MKKMRFLLFICLLVLMHVSAMAQAFTGTRTIGPSGDFQSFGAAVSALEAAGVGAGGVTFEVAPGVYPERFTINTVTGSSAANPIAFVAQGDVTVSGSGTSSTGDIMIQIVGVDYLTFDGINVLCVAESEATRVEIGYRITGTTTKGSNHVTIRNASIQMMGGDEPMGSQSVGVDIHSVAAQASGANNHNIIENLVIDKVATGIRVAGRQETFGAPLHVDTGNIARNNVLGANIPLGYSNGGTGMHLRIQQGMQIYDNVIDRVVSITDATLFGLIRAVAIFNSGGSFYNNRINGVYYEAPNSGAVNGITINTAVTEPLLVYNNFVSNIMKGPGFNPGTIDNSTYLHGIFIDRASQPTGVSGTVKLYHNTVVLDDEQQVNVPSAALMLRWSSQGGANVVSHNNIFINNLTHTQLFPGPYGNYPFAMIAGNHQSGSHLVADNNLYYVADPYGYLIQKGRVLGFIEQIVFCETLEEWQQASGQDMNSVSKQLGFVDLASGDLHLDAESAQDMDLAGIPIEGIDFDIDYDPRSLTAPAKGADEYQPETNPGGLTGVLTIGPSEGKDFPTFTAAVADLMAHGVGFGGVTFMVEPGMYPERFTIETFEGASSFSPVKFINDGGEVTINGTGTSGTADAMVTLRAVSHLTFDGISILDGGSGPGDQVEQGYLITGTASQGSSHVTIKNASIKMASAEGSLLRNTRGVSIVSAATSDSGVNKYNRIENMNIDRVGWGVRLAGRATIQGAPTFVDIGNEVVNCVFGEEYGIGHSEAASSNGIQMIAQRDVRILNNNIMHVFNTPETAPILPTGASGISIDNSGGRIAGNRIGRVIFDGDGASSVNGIRVAVTQNDTMFIENNFISGVYKYPGYVPPSFDNSTYIKGVWVFIQQGGGGHIEAHHNTIYMEHEVPSDYPSVGFYLARSSNNSCTANMRNNIIMNMLIPSGNYVNQYLNTSFAFIDGNPTNDYLDSDYNLFAVNHPEAVIGQTSRALGASVQNAFTIEEWREISQGDFHAISKEVEFVDAAGGDLRLAGASLSDVHLAGWPLENIQTDIDGTQRGVPPARGAHEFVPAEVFARVFGTISEFQTGALLDSVVIEVAENQRTRSYEDGHYTLFLPPGDHNLHLSLEAYEELNAEISLTAGQQLQLDLQLIPLVFEFIDISGSVVHWQDTGLPVEGATVSLDGPLSYETETDDSGAFLFSGVLGEGTYTIHVSAAGFEPYTATIEAGIDDIVLDPVLLEEIAYPAQNVQAQLTDAGALISWGDPSETAEFRYDNGVVEGQLGFQNGSFNSVLGAVHHRNAQLHEVSWYLTTMGGPHFTVKVWVLGLNADGTPNRNDVIYTAEGVPNTDNQWNTYTLSQPLNLPDGFFIGVSSNGFVGLAHDSGELDPWTFVPGTQFATANITTTNFTALEDWDFEVSYLLRGQGYDFGPASGARGESLPLAAATTLHDVFMLNESPQMISSESTPAGVPAWNPLSLEPAGLSGSDLRTGKALSGFDVYRLQPGQEDNPGAWTSLVSGTMAFEYLDAEVLSLPLGDYKYAVVAVYTGGIQADAAFSEVITTEPSIEAPYDLMTSQEGLEEDQMMLMWNHPAIDKLIRGNAKAFTGFNVYLNNLSEAVAVNITDSQYLFSGLAEGVYTAGVQAVYEAGQSNIVTIDFEIVYEQPQLYNLQLTADPTQGGSVSGAGTYEAGTEVTVEATAAANFAFLRWERDGEIVSLEASFVFVMPAADVTLTALFQDETGIGLIENQTLKVYPNPASNWLNLETEQAIGHIRLIDMLGQTVMETSFSAGQHQLDVSSLRPGMYFIQRLDGHNRVTETLRIQISR